MTGIYIHIPFCASKCPYCDFYSFKADEVKKDSYLTAVLSRIKEFSPKISGGVDTLYFGGGTPSVFGGERISRIIEKVRENYSLIPDAEITVECNPSSVDEALVKSLKNAGVNRISMGMQSAVERERKNLGRSSDRAKIKKALELFRRVGIENISLDLMLGIPYQTTESLKESLDFLLESRVKHISAYMLKIEEGTAFSKMPLTLPDEDEVCDLYLFTVDYLRKNGYNQYEISNFSLTGYESRHNLRYWKCEEYLGIGPSAHSFLDGERFYFSRDFDSFIGGASPIPDGNGGNEEEYIMLSLRLTEGLTHDDYRERYGKPIPEEIIKRAEKFQKAGLLAIDEKGIRLNEKGFLVSNGIIGEVIG